MHSVEARLIQLFLDHGAPLLNLNDGSHDARIAHSRPMAKFPGVPPLDLNDVSFETILPISKRFVFL